MHNVPVSVTPRTPPTHTDRKGLFGVVVVSYAYLLTMAGTTIPTPLYPIYRTDFHFSVFIVTVVFATYVVGVLLALFTVGRWSDVFGRIPMQVGALLSAIASTALFLVADDLTVLLVARFFAGLASGVFVATATVHIVELAPRSWADGKASFLATAINVFGLGLGPLFSRGSACSVRWRRAC